MNENLRHHRHRGGGRPPARRPAEPPGVRQCPEYRDGPRDAGPLHGVLRRAGRRSLHRAHRGGRPKAFCAGGDLKERDGMTDAALAAPARDLRADDPRRRRVPDPDHRGRQRGGVRGRHRARPCLRLHLRRPPGPLRAHRGHSGHHARGAGPPEPRAGGGGAAGQGGGAHRPSLRGGGSPRVGRRKPDLRRTTPSSTRRSRRRPGSRRTRRSRRAGQSAPCRSAATST